MTDEEIALDTDFRQARKLVNEAYAALEVLFGRWVIEAVDDDEAPEEVIVWLRAHHRKLAARCKILETQEGLRRDGAPAVHVACTC